MKNKKIYITHCSAKKDISLKNTCQKVFPDELYTAAPTQRFMRKCKKVGVNWAIFSDLYGVWFPDVKHRWYEKHPNKVTEQEFNKLLHNFESMLDCYDEVYFYHHPARFHKLYQRLIKNADLNIIKFNHLNEIEQDRISMGSSEEKCKWLHEQLEKLPLIKYPFKLMELPKRGIYFFYEIGEIWGHGEDKPRIVRVGTHKNNNFRSRIKEHFLLNEKKMNFDDMKPAPKDRSIFRKNIGRTILNREGDQYLEIWNEDLTSHANRLKNKSLRDIAKEKKVENEVTSILRKNFSFRFIMIENQSDRIGSKGLEKLLIGTLSRCGLCKPSMEWFGNHSPLQKHRESGLWQVQHLKDKGIDDNDIGTISDAIERTKKWI